MRIETGTVQILRIFDAKSLDPIRVTLDDIAPGKGRITIECWGKAWASYWGGMGDRTISQFFRQCTAQYLIGSLDSSLQSDRYSADALMALARKVIISRRRGGDIDFDSLDKDEARELFDRIDDLEDCETPSSCWHSSDLLTQLFGQEWYLYVDGRAVEPTPDYQYLSRIVDAVQQGIGLMHQGAPMPNEPLTQGHDDHCRCLNCEYAGLVRLGSDTCPGCGMDGALVFVDAALPSNKEAAQ